MDPVGLSENQEIKNNLTVNFMREEILKAMYHSALNMIIVAPGTKSASSIGLGFFNPTLRPRCWDVTSFCMQLGNREDR